MRQPLTTEQKLKNAQYLFNHYWRLVSYNQKGAMRSARFWGKAIRELTAKLEAEKAAAK